VTAPPLKLYETAVVSGAEGDRRGIVEIEASVVVSRSQRDGSAVVVSGGDPFAQEPMTGAAVG